MNELLPSFFLFFRPDGHYLGAIMLPAGSAVLDQLVAAGFHLGLTGNCLATEIQFQVFQTDVRVLRANDPADPSYSRTGKAAPTISAELLERLRTLGEANQMYVAPAVTGCPLDYPLTHTEIVAYVQLVPGPDGKFDSVWCSTTTRYLRALTLFCTGHENRPSATIANVLTLALMAPPVTVVPLLRSAGVEHMMGNSLLSQMKPSHLDELDQTLHLMWKSFEPTPEACMRVTKFLRQVGLVAKVVVT